MPISRERDACQRVTSDLQRNLLAAHALLYARLALAQGALRLSDLVSPLPQVRIANTSCTLILIALGIAV
jgi:hypothetical protein